MSFLNVTGKSLLLIPIGKGTLLLTTWRAFATNSPWVFIRFQFMIVI
ncbi:hypothetical protein LINPERHAP2_LOCUS40194 [Linum perenne]